MLSECRARPARPDEAAAVAAMFNALNRMDRPPAPVETTAEAVRRDLLSAVPRATLLVAELDGALVGFATGNPVHDPGRGPDAFFLDRVYVLPEARRRGAGRALVAHLAAVARRHGAGRLRCGAHLGGEAPRFCRALGTRDEGGFLGRVLAGPAFEALAEQGFE